MKTKWPFLDDHDFFRKFLFSKTFYQIEFYHDIMDSITLIYCLHLEIVCMFLVYILLETLFDTVTRIK